MSIYTPFTYIIGWTQYKKFYYGAKYAQGCQPSDLWKTYFTSSNYVKEFREEFGEPDIIKIHRTFSDANSCQNFEYTYLTKIDAKNNDSFLNKSNGSKDFCNANYLKQIILENKHPFQTRPDGTSLTQDKVKAGTHNFLTRPDGTNLQTDRIKEGTHHFLMKPDGSSIGKRVSDESIRNGTHAWLTRPDGTNVNTDRVKSGTHHLLKQENGDSIGKRSAKKRIKEGTHHFLTKPDGSSLSSVVQERRVNEGTHNFLKNKGLVSCYDKEGNYVRIPTEQYHSQIGQKENWEYLHSGSKLGRSRKQNITLNN